MADMENGGMLSQADLDALIAAAGQDSAESENFYGVDKIQEEEIELEVEPVAAPRAAVPPPGAKSSGMGGLVDLPSFSPAVSMPAFSQDSEAGLGRVRDIPLEVTVELGRTRLLIRDIMDLSAGSIIELDKIAGEPVDLFANGMLVARGEVIVIDDNFGVRVTEIITAKDRSVSEKETHARAA